MVMPSEVSFTAIGSSRKIISDIFDGLPGSGRTPALMRDWMTV
jgi:hypothetical protein